MIVAETCPAWRKGTAIWGELVRKTDNQRRPERSLAIGSAISAVLGNFASSLPANAARHVAKKWRKRLGRAATKRHQLVMLRCVAWLIAKPASDQRPFIDECFPVSKRQAAMEAVLDLVRHLGGIKLGHLRGNSFLELGRSLFKGWDRVGLCCRLLKFDLKNGKTKRVRACADGIASMS